MRNFIGSAMATTMALSFFCAVILFGSVGMDLAAPAFALGFVACFLWAVKLITAQKVSWKQAPTHWPVIGFVLYAAARYATSPVEYDSRMELIQILFYALVYFLAANNLYHSRDRMVLILITAALTVFEASYGIWQAASQSDMVFMLQRPESYTGRGSGTYICPNHLAGFLEMALGLLAARAAFFHGKRGISEKNVLRKVLLIYAILMALAGILSTFSRAGWLATAAALFALLLWTEGRLRTTWQRAALGGFAMVIMIGGLFLIPKVWGHLNRLFIPETTGGGRTLMWHGTLGVIQESPIFGNGPGTWQWIHQLHRHPDLQIHPVYAHSDPLHLLADYGIVGWVLVVAFFACFFWQVALLTTRKTPSDQRSFAIGASVATIALLAHSWGDFNFHIPANAFFLILIIGFVASMEDPKDRFRRIKLKTATKSAIGILLILLSVTGTWFTGKAALSTWYTGKGTDAKERLAWDKAADYFNKAIRIDPGNPAPYSQLAEVYRLESLWRLGDDKQEERTYLATQAVEFYLESLDRNPFQTQVRVRLANAYELLNEPDKALDTLQTALKTDPVSAFVYQRLGMHHQKQGRLEKAAEAFRRSEELNAGGDEISRLSLEEIQPR